MKKASHKADHIKLYNDIANRLIWHRKLLNMTQRKFVVSITKKRGTYNNWESGSY